MAKEEKTTAAVKESETDFAEELVDYFEPVDPTGEKPDRVVGVNGEFIRIKRGESVKIRRKFLEAIQNANEQERAAYQTMVKAQHRNG